jgi:hypothetical protein
MRALLPVEQIPVTFPTEHEVSILLLQNYQETSPQEDLAFYATLGFVPQLDPPPLPDVGEQASHISSLYLPEGRQIMLLVGRGPATPADEQALVYALAHATQDQAFSIDSLVPCRDTLDAALAVRALVEGDAMMTTARYADLEPDSEEMRQLAQMAADALEPTYAPLVGNGIFDRLRLFPYWEGFQMVAALHEAGGWQAVNRAYGRLPCSTEQVLHPEQYLEAELIQEVAMPDLAPLLGEGWILVRQETVGELLTGLHLSAYLEDEMLALDAADGWAGDTFTLWEDAETRQVIVWRIAWDDRDEAEVFEWAYGLVIPRVRVPALLAVDAPFDLPGRLWEGPAGAAYVDRAGRVVTVIWGPDVDLVTALAQAMP